MATQRWVRYVMPVMVEVDCEDDDRYLEFNPYANPSSAK